MGAEGSLGRRIPWWAGPLALERLFETLAQVGQRAEQVGVGRGGVERVERGG